MCFSVDPSPRHRGESGVRFAALARHISGDLKAHYTKTHRAVHSKPLRGTGLSEEAVRDAIELSETKYCSVAVMLRAVAEITYEYTIVDET